MRTPAPITGEAVATSVLAAEAVACLAAGALVLAAVAAFGRLRNPRAA